MIKNSLLINNVKKLVQTRKYTFELAFFIISIKTISIIEKQKRMPHRDTPLYGLTECTVTYDTFIPVAIIKI